jgi:hypothetical protein
VPPGPPVGTLTVPLRFALGVAAGVVATLAMDQVMARLPEGETSPRIAAGVLTERPPDEAPERLAAVVHYLAGGLSGALLTWLSLVTEVYLAPVPAAVAAGVVQYPLMVGFFASVVLPRSLVGDERVGTIRRDWAISAAAYLLVAVPIVAVGAAAL